MIMIQKFLQKGLPCVLFCFAALAAHAQSAGRTIETIDLADDRQRQVVVDKEAGQYLGHPTTLLLEDGKTILAVYPKGHGRGAIVYKRSEDGGLTWSERLATPKSWETSLETPTLHRVVDADGKKRVILFSGLFPIRMSVSEDDGLSWSELEPIGIYGGIVAMASLVKLQEPGHYMALFHDDGRFIIGGDSGEEGMRNLATRKSSPRGNKWRFTVYQVRSYDGGLTWSVPVPIASEAHLDLCEPGAFRSPDGKQIAVILRENTHKGNSYIIFSDDEGLSWSQPRELPPALTGDRHVAQYTGDGRLFISFRDKLRGSVTHNDWVAWVGTYDDIVNGRDGQYRVRLMDNKKTFDCAYPGVEVLPDDTIVTTTYGHWDSADAKPYIVSVRLKLEELDAMSSKDS